MTRLDHIAQSIRTLHEIIRDELVSACENTAQEQLIKVDQDGKEDTIFAIDRISEKRIIEYFENEIGSITPVILIAEGIGEERQITICDRCRYIQYL